MKTINEQQLSLLKEIAERAFKQQGLGQIGSRLAAWQAICETLFFSSKRMPLGNAAIRAAQVVSGIQQLDEGMLQKLWLRREHALQEMQRKRGAAQKRDPMQLIRLLRRDILGKRRLK